MLVLRVLKFGRGGRAEGWAVRTMCNATVTVKIIFKIKVLLRDNTGLTSKLSPSFSAVFPPKSGDAPSIQTIDIKRFISLNTPQMPNFGIPFKGGGDFYRRRAKCRQLALKFAKIRVEAVTQMPHLSCNYYNFYRADAAEFSASVRRSGGSRCELK
jgi:hypothetical protein